MAGDADAPLRDWFPGRQSDWYAPMKVGPTRESANEGAAAILAGIKTATSSLPSDYADGRPPFAGALSVVLDGAGRAVGIVETLRVETHPFGAADAAFAAAYGEGERTLDWFRRVIGGLYRERRAARGEAFGDDTPLLFEWFRLVRKL
jgi:uncharacterized protein YhfF